jgi:hypothetical protein
MSRIILPTIVFVNLLLISRPVEADSSESLEMRVVKALALLENAEQRFQPPAAGRFYDAQSELRSEVVRVDAALNAIDPMEAQAWKSHLRWHLLEENLHSMSVNLEELELVRRWMFSNREGLEGPLFAELRTRMDAYLDAVFTLSFADLRTTYVEQVALARRQCQAITEEPSDAHAVALGRTLGWLQRTGQLTGQIDKVRSHLSLPNAQIVVSTNFSERLLDLFESEIDQTIPVADTETAPPGGILRRKRNLNIHGLASTVGTTSLEVIANDREVEIRFVFLGQVIAHCRADAGPAAIQVKTIGPVTAVKPIYLNLAGLRLGETVVDSQVRTRLQGVSARSNFISRIAKRRAEQPESLTQMRSSGQSRTTALLRENLDQQIDVAIAKIRAEVVKTQASMGSFREVLAPVAREGAVPKVQGLHSTNTGIELNVTAQRRHQFGALQPYSSDAVGGDLQLRIHISLLNNMLETILGGKTLSDEFLMRYAKILQPQLPLPLMVHSRSQRWAVTTAKYRPIELILSESNRIQLVMRIEAVEIDDQTYKVPVTATIEYQLVKNDFDEYELVRDDAVHFETTLPTHARSFLHKKLDAFFAPQLNGGGVAIPDGGVLGAMNGIEPAGVEVANDWIVIGINIPEKVFDAVMRYWRSKENPDT